MAMIWLSWSPEQEEDRKHVGVETWRRKVQAGLFPNLIQQPLRHSKTEDEIVPPWKFAIIKFRHHTWKTAANKWNPANDEFLGRDNYLRRGVYTGVRINHQVIQPHDSLLHIHVVSLLQKISLASFDSMPIKTNLVNSKNGTPEGTLISQTA